MLKVTTSTRWRCSERWRKKRMRRAHLATMRCWAISYSEWIAPNSAARRRYWLKNNFQLHRVIEEHRGVRPPATPFVLCRALPEHFRQQDRNDGRASHRRVIFPVFLIEFPGEAGPARLSAQS